jgi:signal peptidase II
MHESHSPWRKGGGVIAGGVKFLALVALPFYLLDQLTKWWVHTHYALQPTRHDIPPVIMETLMKTVGRPEKTEVIPGWFDIVYHANTGAAFSIGSGNNMGFVVLSVVAFVGLIFAWKKNVFPDRISQWGVALILSGILGNVTDRLVHGYVVDFISVNLHVRFADPWPTFNIADSCIFIAAALFIIAGIRDARKPKTHAT